MASIIPANAGPYQRFQIRNPEFVARLPQLRAWRDQAMARIGGTERRKQRALVRQVLHGSRFRQLYAYMGLLKAKRIGEATADTIATIADALDPFSPCSEHVRRHWIPAGRQMRAVQSFGPVKRAHQILVADVVRALHPPRENQFLLRGGIPAALSAVEAAYRRGMTHAVELDATGFYGNITLTSLVDALRPLPEAVVRHVIFDESIRTGARTSSDAIGTLSDTTIPLGMVPPPLNDTQGIPLGAASSPIVGEVMIGRLLAAHEIDFDLDVITYADNLLVLGRSEQEADARADQLRDVAATPACGSLRLRVKERGHLLTVGTSEGGGFAAGVSFIGQFGTVDQHGDFSWQPSPDRLYHEMLLDVDECPSLDQIVKAHRKVASYHRAYPRWQGREMAEALQRAKLSSARYLLHATPDYLSEASRDVIFAMLLHGRRYEVLEIVPEYGAAHEQRRKRLLDEIGRCWQLLATAAGAESEAA
ncbi:hypothetical protein [Novosphingobium sp.]|uniref:hypothetical protein n=1 Tax=Novosphingobium sp. TaxID=1874826 RepID=UPI003BA859F9